MEEELKVGREYKNYHFESPFDTICIILGALIIFLTLIEIILLIREMRKETHKSQIYLLNLALSDFVMGLCVLTIFSTWKYVNCNPDDAKKHYSWQLPLQIYCIIGGLRLNLVMSIFSLAALTVDRLLAVVRPFYHRNIKKRYAFFICALTWIISLILSLLNVFLANDPINSHHITEMSYIGRNDSAAVTYYKISTYAFYKETKLLKTEIKLLENIDFLRAPKDFRLSGPFEKHRWYYKFEGKSKRDDLFGYRSEEQGELEYKIIPVLVYLTVAILLAVYFLIWYRMRKSRIQSNSVANNNIRKAKEKRFIILAVSVVVAFSCCWLPFAVFATTFVYTGRMLGRKKSGCATKS